MLDIIHTLIAITALYGVTCLATTALLIFTFRNVHVYQDPARRAFLWLKAAMVMFALSCAFYTIYMSLTVASFYAHYTDWRASFAFSILTPLATSFSDALIVMMLVHAGNGIILARNGQTGKPEKLMLGGSFITVTLIVALALTGFGMRIREFFDFIYLTKNTETHARVSTTLWVAIFIASVMILARSVQVMVKCRSEPRVAKAATFLLCGSLLWFTRAIYVLITTAKGWVHLPPLYEWITEYVFTGLPVFVLFCVFHGLGVKRDNGLWSSSHPFSKLDVGYQQPVGRTNPDNSVNSGAGAVLTESQLEEQAQRNLQADTQVRLHVPN